MSNTIKLLARVACADYGCKNTATVPATLSARIGDGGSVDIDIEPEYPETWFQATANTGRISVGHVYLDYGDAVCPTCAPEFKAKAESEAAAVKERIDKAQKRLRKGGYIE